MDEQIKSFWVFLLFFACGIMGVGADDYNPTNPPEPNTLCKVKVGISPAEAGYVSGSGLYTLGTSLYIGTSANSNYTFKYWTLNGEDYSTDMGFNYNANDASAVFVAVYEYDPVSPSEPQASNKFHLYLNCSPEGACSFNRTNGDRAEAESYVNVEAIASQSFVFKGWYRNGEKVNGNAGFNYYMPAANTTLTAMFEYSPVNPGEPSGSGQTVVANADKGDVNKDGTVDVTDGIVMVNHYVAGTTSELGSTLADVNGDGTIDVTDAIRNINIYLKK